VYDMASDMMRSEEFSVVYWYWKILMREVTPNGVYSACLPSSHSPATLGDQYCSSNRWQ
jgi:hypothetical protein